MTDRYLLEAMREVDELTPSCPPIAPPLKVHKHVTVAEMDDQLARYACWCWMCRLGLSHESGSAMMQNAANRSMTPEELARYSRGMQNAARPTETIDSDGRPIGRT